MSARVLGLELRRSAALWAGLAVAPAALTVAQAGNGMAVVIGDQRQALILMMPLATAVGAWQARRDRRSGTSDLLGTSPRPAWHRYAHTAAALGIGVVVAYALILVVAAVFAARVGAHYPVDYWVKSMIVTAWLTAAVLLGAAIGRAISWVVTPPLAALSMLVGLTAIALFTDTEVGPGPHPGTWLLPPAPSYDSYITLLTPEAARAQLVWAISCAAAAGLLYVATRWLPLVALGVAGAGLVAAMTLLPEYLHQGVQMDETAVVPVCTPEEPVVCALRVHPLVLDDLLGPGGEALTALSERLPNPPNRVEEAYYSWTGYPDPWMPEPARDVVSAEIYTDGSGRLALTPTETLWSVALGAGTAACPNVPQEMWDRDATARVVAAAWVLQETPPEPDPDGYFNWIPPPNVTRPAYEALLGLPEDVQYAQVAAYRDSALACTGEDRLALLLDGES